MPISPECNYMSACLDSQEFEPGKHHIGERHFKSHTREYHFLVKYVEQAGHPPTLDHMQKKYPEFEYTEEVHLGWAADELRHEFDKQQLIALIQAMAEKIAEGDLDGVRALMREALTSHAPPLKGYTFGDEELFTNEDRETVPLPGKNLQAFTAGIEPGMITTYAARTGVGKSWLIARTAIAAMEAGWDVVYFSLEMDARMCNNRLARMIVGTDYDDMKPAEARWNVLQWLDSHGASMTLRTPQHGIVTPETVASHAKEKTVILIDHIGLMSDNSGQMCITDWRVAASVSNSLKMIAQTQMVPIVLAAQQNRGAEHQKDPSIDTIAGTDAIGQDSDIVLFMSRPCEMVMNNHLIKNRTGRSGRWYSSFDPSGNNFEDLNTTRAVSLINEEKVANSAVLLSA